MVELMAGTTHGLSRQFAQRASDARQQIDQIETFTNSLESTLASGKAPSGEDLSRGRQLLSEIDDRAELYAFNAAILAGQSASNDSDIENKVEAISRGLERAQMTSERLRRTLETFG